MGLLDDAIREHLELKRRHGADASDVAKLEHDAFGPIERDAATGAASDPPLPHDAEAAHETALEEELAYEEAELEAEEEWDAGHPTAETVPIETASEPTPSTGPAVYDAGAELNEPAAQAEPSEPGEHDELEETPEFLQETPEHERLWFEQKPPRDFDF